GVHRAPEALVPIGQELPFRDQPVERGLDQLVARLHVVEDLLAQDEEAAVDEEVGVSDRPELRDVAVRPHPDLMEAVPGLDGGEACDCVAALELLVHLVERDIGETVTVVREEHGIRLEVVPNDHESYADIAMKDSVDEGNAPAVQVDRMQLDFSTALAKREVIRNHLVVVQKVLADCIAAIAEAEDEI